MAASNIPSHGENSSPSKDLGVVQIDEEILACSVCYEYYNGRRHKPCVLPDCGHVVCSSCASSLWENRKIRCPTCRKMIDVTALDTLPINHGLLDVIKGLSQKKSIKEYEENLNQLYDAKAVAIHKFDEFCKNLATVQDRLFRNSIESLRQAQSMLTEFANISEVYHSGLQSLNDLQRMKTKADYQHIDEKLVFVKTLLSSLDCIQLNNNCLNGSNIPSMHVVMDERRSADLTFESRILHLYCFGETEESKDIAIPMADVEKLYISKDVITAFLDITQDEDVLGRLYLNLCGQKKYTQQFASMCLGVHGPSYKNMEFTASMGRDLKFLSSGIYVDSVGKKDSYPPGESLNLDDLPQTNIEPGFIVPRIDNLAKVTTRFLVFLKAIPNKMPCAGKVETGMAVVHKIRDSLQNGKNVFVNNCGIVLEERKEE
ncbi:uncharacterized protein LOC143018093 isoform X2 [Oratosquilla oratoria]|uniref:uncharacterized protein LOC143018093 isoform X2 n=1 Tax=Oratosquilla oratoria TaxID=337810 RepID=UPI003F769DB5